MNKVPLVLIALAAGTIGAACALSGVAQVEHAGQRGQGMSRLARLPGQMYFYVYIAAGFTVGIQGNGLDRLGGATLVGAGGGLLDSAIQSTLMPLIVRLARGLPAGRTQRMKLNRLFIFGVVVHALACAWWALLGSLLAGAIRVAGPWRGAAS